MTICNGRIGRFLAGFEALLCWLNRVDETRRIMTDKRADKQKIDSGLRKEFLRHMPEKVEAILENWRFLVKSDWDADTQKKLVKRLHSLVLLANKFGLDRTCRVTRSLQQRLENAVVNAEGGLPSQVTIRELDALFLAFSVAIHDGKNLQISPKSSPTNQRKRNPKKPTPIKRWLYLFGIEERRIKGLLPLLEELDVRCRHFEGSEELFADMDKHLVIAVVCRVDLLDTLLPEKEAEEQQILRPTVIVIAESGDLKLRLHAMRKGVDLYLTEPLDFALFATKIDHLIYPEEPPPSRVLVIENTTDQADGASAILAKAGYEIEVVADPFQVMQSLENFHPDLILMDLYLPEVSGVELAVIIKEHTDFADIPIIFLSEEQDVDVQLQALSAGGEGFIVKPIVEKQLISIVSNHIKRAEERHQRLGRLKLCDKATGFFSRNYLLERLDRIVKLGIEGHHPMGLLFIELDTPDHIAERIGISGVDVILADIGKLLNEQTTESDLLARFGDYSFSILTTIHGLERLTAMAEMIRRSIADHLFGLVNQSVMATVSIGVLPLRTFSEDSSEAINKVKSVTNLAKERGGNQVQRYKVHDKLADDRWIRELIGEALNDKLFEVYYQPMVGLHGMTGEFYQTLLRLRTSGKELISASEFIHVAEQYGLIDDIDRWVVEHAVNLLAERKNRPHAIRFFICQSASTLLDPSRLAWLKSLLSRQGIGFNRLTFEFKMSDIKANFAASKTFIEALNKMNVSSLVSEFTDDTESYQILKHLPTHFVKVDIRYLRDLKSQQMAIIKKLHDEKMVVIAPCVEDPNSIARLWSSGADFVQGYFIQRPNVSLDYDFNDSILN
ncbi:MAG: EAL domain-containing protein [Candidatus Polarisedimenticolaceae bacterium]|nr:EAL domain-containing protein [Candidatus Polarisedimenticolaceae bacterium]